MMLSSECINLPRAEGQAAALNIFAGGLHVFWRKHVVAFIFSHW